MCLPTALPCDVGAQSGGVERRGLEELLRRDGAGGRVELHGPVPGADTGDQGRDQGDEESRRLARHHRLVGTPKGRPPFHLQRRLDSGAAGQPRPLRRLQPLVPPRPPRHLEPAPLHCPLLLLIRMAPRLFILLSMIANLSAILFCSLADVNGLYSILSTQNRLSFQNTYRNQILDRFNSLIWSFKSFYYKNQRKKNLYICSYLNSSMCLLSYHPLYYSFYANNK